ncbi:PapB/FocB family fimbrial expression transcriptional regulator [Vibrio litoralis]|uniref:PapB/FocB family fimbrial expression transcriptional regulator n=1 Tax=Vibrio litoralis TaxID=335972 RepID=UPI000402F6E6|nr:PapB/FocB family fimbrial expression transcriptional regulator [Vibrio litoralis]
MNYLSQGLETEERFLLLLSLTKIRSDSQVKALRMYLVDGLSFSLSASLNEITEPNFQRAMNRLEKVAGTIEKIKEIDWIKSVK